MNFGKFFLSFTSARKHRNEVRGPKPTEPACGPWRLTYGNATILCETEEKAKQLARQLVKRGYRVRAHESEEGSQRTIEPHQIVRWLVE